MPGMTWEYVSIVCEMVAWPSISETILGFTFLESSSVAHAWRREWKVKPESPAFSSSGLKPRWYRLSAFIGLPARLENTRPWSSQSEPRRSPSKEL